MNPSQLEVVQGDKPCVPSDFLRQQIKGPHTAITRFGFQNRQLRHDYGNWKTVV
jgi:hypothetical protein